MAWFFGLIDSWLIFPALIVVFFSCLFFASLGFLVTTVVKNFDQIIYPSSGLIVPMSLFSGTYFPVENMPSIFKYLCYLLPLTHTVRIVRGILNTGFDYWMIGNFLYLIVLTYVIFRICIVRLGARILN